MKRIISLLLSLAIIMSLFGGIDMSVFATTTESKNSEIELIDIDIYRAQCFAGIAYNPNTDAVEDCNAIYNYYIDEGIYSPTKSFLDAVYADEELMAEFALWQLESLGVDSSSIVDTPVQKKDYYESLITAIIAHEYAEDSPKTQDLAIQATGYSATIVDSLCNITDSADTLELVDKLDVNSPDTMKVLEQMFNEHPELGGLDVIDIILSASNTIMDAIEKIAAYSTMHLLDQETKDWLESMYNACDENTDAALKAALFNLMNASFSFTHAVLVDIKDTSFRLANWGIGATMNVGLSMLAATNPLTTAIMAGLKLGKTICDICFATSDICEQLFLLECMYDIQSLARTVTEDAKSHFVNSQTNENAKAFTYAAHYYFESIINTDIDCMVSFLDLLYNGGLLKGALTWVYGVTDDYQEAVDSLESLREVRQNNYNLMINLYKAALAINHKDTYDYYYTVDNIVPITSIRFRETWLLPMEVGDFSNIYVQYEPSNTTQKAYTVTSDNPAVVEVHDNIITAVAEGTANITIRSVENPQIFYTAQITVGGELEGPSSKFRYRVIDDEAIITGLVEGYEPSNLTIPSHVDGYSVVAIGKSAFEACQNLKRVTISDGITSIGDIAFRDCTGLTSITIPDSVTYIGGSAFRDCAGLTNVAIPDSVTSIGYYAFEGCTGLTSVMIPDSVTYIGGSAFRDCAGLTNVAIPDSVTSIGYYAFEGCTGLISITIPDSITEISWSAFGGCTGLTSITIPDGVTSIEGWAFSGCSNLTSVTISKGVNSIGVSAFRNCTSLTSVTIPDSVTSIGEYTFYGCSSLTNITISDGVTSIGASAFEGCSSLTNMTIREGVTSVKVSDCGTGIGERAFYGCSSLTSITIPDGVTNIDKLAFYGCSNLTSVVIPKSVTNIGDQAFNDCSGLTSVKISDGATSSTATDGVNHIGEKAFYGCSSLTSMTVPDGVTSIGNYAFSGCSNLTSVIISESVINIGDYAFSGCSSLTSVTIPEGVTSVLVPESATRIGNYAFNDCSSLTSVAIPEGITSIGYWAFDNCSSLISVTIPEGVTSIDKYAFYNCSSLTSVTLPESVTSIGINVFNGCDSLNSVFITNLSAWCNNFINFDSNPLHYGSDLYINGELVTELIIPDGITTLVPAVFRNCTSITSVIIPQGVTSIEEWAFSGCSNLTSVTISKGVNSIGESAFEDCTSLTSITIPDSVISIGDSAFENCTSLTSIAIPDSVVSIGSALFSRCSSLTSVIIPEGITSIGDWLFYRCSSLSGLAIPDSVTTIGEWTFRDCTSLTSVTIPDSVTIIKYEAFAYCSDLVEIYFEGDAPNIETRAFNRVTANAYYPAGNETWTEEVICDYGGDITWIPYYEILQGADSVLDADSNEMLTIRASGEFSKFESVSVDNVIVDASCYSVSEGSTIVVFSTDYLRTLAGGEHIVSIHFSDGIATTTMTILVSVGDIDGDGEISDWDAIILNRYLAGWDVTITQSAADVDGDGEVSDWDAIVLERYLAGWDVEITAN